MYTFGQLAVGDLFNVKAGRFIKTNTNHAMCVMSGCMTMGQQYRHGLNVPVLVLWSSTLPDVPSWCDRKPAVQHASCSESEKEDRFYRKIEAEIEAENREREAAEFKQSLIDERDALMERRRSIGSRLATMEYTDPEFFLLNVQEDVMGRYTNVLRQRLRLLDKPVKQTV